MWLARFIWCSRGASARSICLVSSLELARSVNLALSPIMARSIYLVLSPCVARSQAMVLSIHMARSCFLVALAFNGSLAERGALCQSGSLTFSTAASTLPTGGDWSPCQELGARTELLGSHA